MNVQRSQPGVDDPDLQDIVGEGPFDLFWCPHRNKDWHLNAHLIWLQIHKIRLHPGTKHKLAESLETLVNTGLNRDNQPKPVEKRCHICNTPLIEYPYKFDLHSFAAAMVGRFTWKSSHVCPHAKADWHDALKFKDAHCR